MKQHKLKRPDGYVVEEYITSTAHLFERGKFQLHDNDVGDGRYTGRIAFAFLSKEKLGAIEKQTRWYTEETAPKWLLELYREAIEQN